MFIRKFILPLLLFGLLISFSATKVKSQNLLIDSVSLPAVAYSCSSTVVTVYTYLGCINFTHVGNSDSVSGSTIGIKILHNSSMICYGAITYPTHTINLGYLLPGTYSLTVTGNYVGAGVVSTVTKTLVVLDCCPNAGFTADFNVNDTSVCENDSVFCTNTSTGNGGLTYKWYVDGVYVTNTTNFNTQLATAGLYEIELVTDSGGACKRFKRTEIDVAEIPQLNLGPDKNFCVGQSAVLNAGPGWDSLYWSTAQNTTTISVSDSGNYILTARDTSHCQLHYDTLHVAFKPTPVVNLGNDTTLCEGVKITLNASNSGATYLWHDNNTSPAIQVSTAGKYWVRASFSNNCSASDTINISYKVCTGIEENNNDETILVYPNPFSDVLYVRNTSGKVVKNVAIYNTLGASLYESAHITENSAIDVSFLPSGMYVVQIQFEDSIRLFNLIKKTENP